MIMDSQSQTNYYQHQNLLEAKSLKKVTQLMLLSFSVFSLLFSYFFKTNFYVFPYHLLSHTLDKNLTFLICNGILVFLAKTSGLLCSRSRFDLNDHRWIKKIGDGLQAVPMTKTPLLDNQVLAEEKEELEEEEEEKFENSMVEDKAEETEIEFLNTEGVLGHKSRTSIVENDQKDSENCFPFEEAAEEESQDSSMGLLSTEELNKKFDEFIRKMKEELRIQAQQQLIMV